MELKRAQGSAESSDPAELAAGEALDSPSDAAGRIGFSVTMEEELYRLLGRLLGTLEAMATDPQEPLSSRQTTWLQQALDSGHQLKEHIEALAFLASPEPEVRLVRAPYSVRRMVEHAVRGAGWQATERDVSLLLPPLEHWAERMVDVDVRAIDRVIRGLCEHLVLSVWPGGRVEVSLAEAQGRLQVSVQSHGAVSAAERVLPGELLLAAWQRIVRLHGGSLTLDVDCLKAELWLPLCGA